MLSQATHVLQSRNIKPSIQRMAILQWLMDHPIHPTVETIFSALSPKMPTLSKTTVYNTLKLLSEEGAIQTLTIDERNTCYDADIKPHAHFLCSCCQRVYDLPAPTGEGIPSTGDMLNGHSVQEVHFYYKGVCSHCLNEQEQ